MKEIKNFEELDEYLYRGSLIFAILISIIFIIFNIIVRFPILINIKWLFLILMSLFFYKFDKNQKKMKFYYFGFLIWFFIPYAFIDSGGSANNTILYSFLLVMILNYLFKGIKRLFLVFSLVIVNIILIYIEFKHPYLVKEYSITSQFIDRMIQIFFTFSFSTFITSKYSKIYEKLNQKLFRLANYDILTNTFNRNYFNMHLNELIKDYKYLILLDMDNFKKLNDNYGHLLGDKALIKIVELLKENFKNDIICRWGGDEFVILSNLDNYKEKLLKTNQKFCEYIKKYEESVNFSYGVAIIDSIKNPDELFRLADLDLYKNKTIVKS
ncbi:diguanylate cyclase (GGDEF)-like protein [Hypnocyclicus thermotrophus]|uniref:Diguanylate cyclase (GGDEF)-like protein n=1 Tax=Hypnocyclicus thermotrophus TaxID=1627895 RepID=A0AA46I6H9_9FUSO|nr:GGDEF domain-containing protein [Hypnocyclicus thermotrophus]TDT72475.1 diguanylate cyclase (GGDEF)-like protein [Hypnocyclicus thermotrophus]